jgi:hypothetical protein
MSRVRPVIKLLAGEVQNYIRKKRLPIQIIPREPVPLDSEWQSLVCLPDNIVRLILGFVQDLDSYHVLTMALLSSSLYKQARYVQHCVVHINLDKSRHIRDRLDLVLRSGLLPAIRVLEIRGTQIEGKVRGILDSLASMLPSMAGLRDLDWKVGQDASVPIPPSILEALTPKMRLHTSASSKFPTATSGLVEPANINEFLASLENSPNLVTLSVHITCGMGSFRVMTRALKQVLISCPNLRRIPMLYLCYTRSRFIKFSAIGRPTDA